MAAIAKYCNRNIVRDFRCAIEGRKRVRSRRGDIEISTSSIFISRYSHLKNHLRKRLRKSFKNLKSSSSLLISLLALSRFLPSLSIETKNVLNQQWSKWRISYFIFSSFHHSSHLCFFFLPLYISSVQVFLFFLSLFSSILFRHSVIISFNFFLSIKLYDVKNAMTLITPSCLRTILRLYGRISRREKALGKSSSQMCLHFVAKHRVSNSSEVVAWKRAR